MEPKEFFERLRLQKDPVLLHRAKKASKVVAVVVFGFAFVAGLFLFYINYTDFAPLMEETLTPSKRIIPEYIEQRQLRFLTWNIGYGGLGNTMDFFSEDGKKVRATKEETQNWFEQIVSLLVSKRDMDFILLQEVDFDSKRTYTFNQHLALTNALFFHESVFALNYHIPFVSFPLTQPIGKVHSGQMTLSRFASKKACRVSYPQIASWPRRMFLHDRCFIETRYPIQGGSELVVLHTHNSNFARERQKIDLELDVIRKHMIKEYEKGNFVVAGGDWNVNPPGFEPSRSYNYLYQKTETTFPKNILPADWQFAYSVNVPTNRFLNTAFLKSKTYTTTVDFFIVSPNVDIIAIEAIDLAFESSNHHPVMVTISLK